MLYLVVFTCDLIIERLTTIGCLPTIANLSIIACLAIIASFGINGFRATAYHLSILIICVRAINPVTMTRVIYDMGEQQAHGARKRCHLGYGRRRRGRLSLEQPAVDSPSGNYSAAANA